tara:strand:- start:627 stop:1040 length:414 start_codon:yes stop_codon:yes gene_type:complete
MASNQKSRPVTLQDALIFVSKRTEDNVNRLTALEKTLEEVAGDDGGEKDFAALKTESNQTTERVDNLTNRLTNLEKKVTKSDKKKGDSESQLKLVLEQFGSLREEFEKLEELVHKQNQVDLLVTEDDEEEEVAESSD